MVIGIYVRVSTILQVKKGLSIDDQIRRGIEFCENNKFKYEIYNEGGMSGFLNTEDRPELNRLMNKITNKKKREIDGVYITEMERLVRNPDEGLLIYSSFVENNIKLFLLGVEQDLNDSTTSLILKFKFLLGDFERKKVQERVKRNLETSVIKGRVGGGSLLNYGYMKGDNKQLIVNEEESIIVKQIYQYYLDGFGTKKISGILNESGVLTKRMNIMKGDLGNGKLKVRGKDKSVFLWRDSVIYKILTNSIYKGERLFVGKVYNSPVIISPEIFDSVQLLLKKRNYFKDTTNKHFYLLKGLIYCNLCGSRMLGKKRNDLSDNFYYCGSKRHKEDNCKSRSVNIDILNDLVWSTTKKLSFDYNLLMSKKSNNKSEYDDGRLVKEVKFLDEHIDKLTRKYNKTISLFNDDDLTYNLTKEYLEEIKIEIKEYEELKIKLIHKYDNLSVEKNFYLTLNNYCKRIILIKSEDKKRSVLQSVIDRIEVRWDDVLNKHIIKVKYIFNDINSFLLTREIGLKYKSLGGTFKLLGTEKVGIEISFLNINKRNENFSGTEFKSILKYED